MRTERVISNLPDLRDTLSVRSRIALNAGAPSQAGEAAKLRTLDESPFSLKETTLYQRSSAFDDNGDFQPPIAYGMITYKSVEQNTCMKPSAGSIISIYA